MLLSTTNFMSKGNQTSQKSNTCSLNQRVPLNCHSRSSTIKRDLPESPSPVSSQIGFSAIQVALQPAKQAVSIIKLAFDWQAGSYLYKQYSNNQNRGFNNQSGLSHDQVGFSTVSSAHQRSTWKFDNQIGIAGASWVMRAPFISPAASSTIKCAFNRQIELLIVKFAFSSQADLLAIELAL